ncbi:MAG: hypothetical protein JWO32_365 [Bacteroidetes bacterium]|nr:hypothetical protein [Bacteroidota bacterium]
MNIHQTILQGVKEQLFFYDYLVLPGFGGFVLKKIPAHFSSTGSLILPPSKMVSFNSQLKQNDGVLVHWLQSELKVDSIQALKHLDDFAEYCRSLLGNRGRLNMDGIGFFYLDFENNICFEPQQHNNFSTESFGLSPVYLKELDIEIPVLSKTVFIDREINSNTSVSPAIKNQRNYRKVAVAAVSGAVLFSALLVVISTVKINGPLKAAVFGSEVKTTYSPVNYSDLQLKNLTTEKKDYLADANGIASLELDNNKIISVKALEIEISNNTATTTSRHHTLKPSFAHKKFEVVLGCFSILNNAKKMVGILSQQNIKAIVAGQNEKGLYIVSGGGYSSKEEAQVQLAEIKSTYPNAWIKKGE